MFCQQINAAEIERLALFTNCDQSSNTLNHLHTILHFGQPLKSITSASWPVHKRGLFLWRWNDQQCPDCLVSTRAWHSSEAVIREQGPKPKAAKVQLIDSELNQDQVIEGEPHELVWKCNMQVMSRYLNSISKLKRYTSQKRTFDTVSSNRTHVVHLHFHAGLWLKLKRF